MERMNGEKGEWWGGWVWWVKVMHKIPDNE